MVNLKKWMAKVTERLKTLVLISYKDYSGTTGTSLYGGYYYGDMDVNINGKALLGFSVRETDSNMPVFLMRTRSGTVRAYSSTSNYNVTIRCFYWGGVISYLIHLTESLKSFRGGRRWAYAEPQEIVDEAVRTGELSYSGGYGNLRDIDKREWHSVGDHPETVIRDAHWYSWILHRWNSWEQRNKRLCHENSHERGSACCQEHSAKRGIHQTASVLSCSRLTTIPGEGVMAC